MFDFVLSLIILALLLWLLFKLRIENMNLKNIVNDTDHRLLNSLQMASSFSDLLRPQGHMKPNGSLAISVQQGLLADKEQTFQNRLRLIGRAHGLFGFRRKGGAVALNTLIRELCECRHVHFIDSSRPILVTINDAIYTGLIVLSLIGEQSAISVLNVALSDPRTTNHFNLSIRVLTPKEHEYSLAEQSAGQYFCDLIEQLNTRMEIKTHPDSAEASLSFPLKSISENDNRLKAFLNRVSPFQRHAT